MNHSVYGLDKVSILFGVVTVNFLQIQAQRGQWGSQLMCRISGEAAFTFQSLIQSSQQAVDCVHQSSYFFRSLTIVEGMDVLRCHVPNRFFELSQRLETHLN